MHIKETTWPPKEYPVEETVFWTQASWENDIEDPPQVGVNLVWTKGWKPALYLNLWSLKVAVGWFQP
jgi:hypothetical protein